MGAVSKLLEQAGKIRDDKTLNINIVKALRGLIASLHADGFTGDPAIDWLIVKHALQTSGQNELLRVGITRARIHTLIVDPIWPTCPILSRHRL